MATALAQQNSVEYYTPTKIVQRLTDDIKSNKNLPLFEPVLRAGLKRLKDDYTALNDAQDAIGNAYSARIVKALKVLAFYDGVKTPSRVGVLNMLASKGKRFQANDLNDNNIADVFLAMKDCTSDEEYRPVMHGIHLEQGNTAKETIAVTTNGFILASTLFTTTDDAIVNRNPDVVNDPTIQGSNTGNYDVTKRGALIYTETISTQSFPPWRNVVPSFPRMAGFSKQWAKGAMVALDVQKTFILDVAKALQAIDLVNSAEKAYNDLYAVVSALNNTDTITNYIEMPPIGSVYQQPNTVPIIRIGESFVNADLLRTILNVALTAGFTELVIDIRSKIAGLTLYPLEANKVSKASITNGTDRILDMVLLLMPVRSDVEDFPTLDELGVEGTIIETTKDKVNA